MLPIPSHLTSLPWYSGNLAYRISCGFVPRHNPGEAKPVRANLTDADLYGANLSGADLSGVDLTGAILAGTDCRGALFIDADLTGVDLAGANLLGSDFSSANLRRADLTDADCHGIKLLGAVLAGTNFFGAIGIRAAGPVGTTGRTIYGVAHVRGTMIQAGCHWDTLENTRRAIEAYYPVGSWREKYRADYLAALEWVGRVPYYPE